MPFLAYVAVMIVAVGSVLLGVEVITSPPPQKAATHAAITLAQHEAAPAKKMQGDPKQDLTPIYPASPGGSKDVRVVYPPSNEPQASAKETTGSAPAAEANGDKASSDNKTARNGDSAVADNAADDAKQDSKTVSSKASPASAPQQSAPEQSVKPQQAKATPPAKTEKAGVSAPPQSGDSHLAKANEESTRRPVQAAAEHVADHCEIQACSSAYSSFRASDCTYQPYDGPRRLCTKAPLQRSAEREHARDREPAWMTRVDPRVGPRIIERMRGPYADEADDDYDEVDAPRDVNDGGRMIVIQRDYRRWP